MVVWNEEHHNYTILQETNTLYFLHSDCLDVLGLRPSSDGIPRRLYSTGEVVEKEYCHAKKVNCELCKRNKGSYVHYTFVNKCKVFQNLHDIGQLSYYYRYQKKTIQQKIVGNMLF